MSATRISSTTMTKAAASYSSSSSLEEGNSSSSGSMGQRGNRCEECMKKPAHWYCVADEAYLCELCDAIVHSSNCVAKRHKRMRVDDMNIAEVAETSMTTSSSTTYTTSTTTTNSVTGAATRKRPRTSWGRPHSNYSSLSLRTLPPPLIAAVKQEINPDFFLSTDVLPSFLADMDLPLHDMPRFLSMADDAAFFPLPSIECCKSSPPSPSQTLSGFSPVSTASTLDFTGGDEINCFGVPENCTVDDLLTGCFYELHRDLHLIMGETKADTCSDMDSMDTSSNDNSNMTTTTNNNDYDNNNDNNNNIISTTNDTVIVYNSVKVEMEGCTSESSNHSSEDLEEEYTIDLSDFELPDDSFLPDDLPEIKQEMENDCDNRNHLRLSLNFTDVLFAWSEKDSPWLDGKRPEGLPDLQLPEVTWQAEEVQPFVPSSFNYGEPFVNLDLLTVMGTCAGMGKSNENRINNINSNSSDSGDREARVMRYREKRRTRLFSKKIRYEVRKLNAERRPRMKGRFIKRILGATDSS